MSGLPVTVLFCADSPYFQHAGAAMASMLRAAPESDFQIFVCSERREGAAEEKLAAITSTFRNASITFLEFDIDPWREHLRLDHYITTASYLRLFVTEFLSPRIERLIYLD